MKKLVKKNIHYILLFLFFTLILFLCPISGDDWGNYLVGSKGIKNSIINTITLYKTWEGRLLSRFLINILTYNKIIWNILNSVIITSTIYLIQKLIKPTNNKTTFLFICLIFFALNPYIFSQTITWIAGNITYLFVIPFFLFYINYIIEKKYIKSNHFETFIITLLNILMTMFIEHMGALLVLFNMLAIVYNYIKEKQINKKLILYLLASIIGLLVVVISPGSKYRSTIENIEFSNLSMLEKIKYNSTNFINYTYIYNPYLLILMSFSSFLLIKRKKNNKYLKFTQCLYLSAIPIIISINYMLQFLKLNAINLNNTLLLIYFLIYIIIILKILIFNYKEKNKEKIILFYILGLAANLIMLISPTWGYRTTLLTYILLSISNILIIDKNLTRTNKLQILLSITLTVTIIYYLTLYINVFIAQQDLKENIKLQLENKNKIIEITQFPSFANCNINPENIYHQEKFKEYYKIPKEVEIKLIDQNWKYKIIYIK